jgi:hypothetical protein
MTRWALFLLFVCGCGSSVVLETDPTTDEDDGGGGVGGGCTGCSELANGVSDGQLCPGAEDALAALQSCKCTACREECAESVICGGTITPVPGACNECQATAPCQDELKSCLEIE